MILAPIFSLIFNDDEKKQILKEVDEFKNRYGSECLDQYLILRSFKQSKGYFEVYINEAGIITLFNAYEIKADITIKD